MFDPQLIIASLRNDNGHARRRIAIWVLGFCFAVIVVGLIPADGYAHQRDENKERDEEEERDHDGFFSRVFLGIGYGSYIGSGRFDPIPGVRLIEDPSLGSPALNIALDGGVGIIDNLAIHFSVAFETLLVSKEDSGIDGFYLFGLGGGATYYFMPFDFYLSGHIRWAGALFYLPNAPCDIWVFDKFKGFDGIGLSLAFGKEWFTADNDAGIGIGLQGNWVHLGGSPNFNYFSILLVPTLVSF